MNVLSQFWTLQAFLPRMVELDRGHVLCMSSTAGVTGTPFLTAYCASKHANKGMMEALLMEHRQERPRCRVGMTTVHPFTVRRKHFKLFKLSKNHNGGENSCFCRCTF